MAQTSLILLTLAATFACFLAFGAYTVKSLTWKATHREATFPGSGLFHSSPAQVTEKYHLSIYPAPWAISIIWPAVLFWNLAAMFYLLYKSVSECVHFNIPSRTYYLWTGAWVLTTIWTFWFDQERHLGTLTAVFFVTVFSFKTLSTVCQSYNALSNKTKSENVSHPFRYLVVEAHAVIAMWSDVAFAISIGYALAYKNSLHMKEATLTGIFTPEESATVGAIFILASFISWWILDVAYWGQLTDCIKTIYPGLALVMLSLGLSNYAPGKGMTLNNFLCFGLSALSAFAMLTRQRAKKFFLKRQDDSCITVNGHHRD